MERLPLVSEFLDPENGDDFADVQDDMEPLPGVGAQQPTRSKNWMRTAAAILVLGAVATVIAAGPIHNQIVADPGHAVGAWDFKGAWDSAKEKAGQAYHSVSSEVSKHMESVRTFVDENISDETRAYLADKIQSLKNAPKWAQEEAQKMVCNMRAQLADVKARLATKMKKDFIDKSTTCGQDFTTVACRDECVNDACEHVPALEAQPNQIAGFNLNDIANAPKNMCKVFYTEIVKHIQDNLAKEASTIEGQQEAQSDFMLKSSIDAQMGEVDKEFEKVC